MCKLLYYLSLSFGLMVWGTGLCGSGSGDGVMGRDNCSEEVA